MKPYRRQIVGLPLQRSIFDGIADGPRLIGVEDVVPGGRMTAWLDDEGDLFIDPSHMDLMRAALRERVASPFLETVERAHQTACETLTSASERCAAAPSTLTEAELRVLLGDLGASLVSFVPYGILSKFVPDELFGALQARVSGAVPPFPDQSAGAALSHQLARLYLSCRSRDYSAERLMQEWPHIHDRAVANQVRDFCRQQVGNGPLVWEAAGYERPQYVFSMMRTAFGSADPGELESKLNRSARSSKAIPAEAVESRETGDLRRVLGFWLDFLERQTWCVRRAFYVGARPVLQALAAAQGRCQGLSAADLLFFSFDELREAKEDINIAETRRQRYIANSDYLSRHGVEQEGLKAIWEEL